MERKNPVLKIAAIVSAVLLAGAFVSYRAGAFERFTKPKPQPQPAVTAPAPEVQPAPGGEQSPQMYMYSSKSAPAFTPELQVVPVAPANPAPAGSPPTYMGGSKYIVVAPNPADLSKPAPPEPPKP